MTLPTTVRPPGRPRDHRATKAITAAALRQLTEVGYGRLSMDSVASEAGVARATVYRRYRDKADLVTAAIAELAASFIAAQIPENPRDALEQFLLDFDANFSRFCIEVLGALLGNREDPGALTLHRERTIAPRRSLARSLLEEARDRGELRPDADLDLALDMLVGVVFARAVTGDETDRGWAARALDAIWKGMGPQR